MVRRLTSRSSVENLRKEAKRWLKALRAHDEDARARLLRAVPTAGPDPSLRDVQHALAVEYGMSGWIELTTQTLRAYSLRSRSPPPHRISGDRLRARRCTA